jgi:outer membrane protein insertion porin family
LVFTAVKGQEMRKILSLQYVLFLFISFFLVNLTYAQSEKESPPSEAQVSLGEPAPASNPASTEEKAGKLVSAIEVKGNKAISTNIIISKMKTRVGSPYLENVISDDLKRLYLLGFFSDIKIDTGDYKDGLKVLVTVVERPIIEKITFSGILRITMKDEKLKEKLKSKEGQYLDYPKLAEDTDILKKMYEKIGYSQVRIEHKVDIDKEANKAKIEFKVDEGKRVRIKDISVEGNKNFSRRRLLKLIKTKRAWLFNAGILKEEVLGEDIERIKSFYRKQGFADAVVDYEVKTDAKRPYLLYITVKVQEGRKYLVGNISVIGNQNITTKDILKKLKECVPGKVFSQEALKEDIANIQGLYFDKGYIFAQVEETTSLNSYTGRIDITYNIAENAIAYVDKIKVKGNIKTKDIVIRRELRVYPGDRFDGEKLRRSKERLQNLGFFEEISYDTEDTATPNRKNLVVDVKESKTGAFSFGGGYSTVDEFVGFVEIEQKNFDWKNFPYFTGDGQNLRVRASFGTVSDSYELSFTEPWIFDYPLSFGFDVYKRTHKREHDIGYGYDEKILGQDLRLGKDINDFLRANIGYRHDIIEITSVPDDATNALKRERGKSTLSRTEYGLTFDSRDNVFSPSKGSLLTGAMDWAGGPWAGDKDFWKFFGRASHYFPMFRGSVFEVRGRVGLTDDYGDSTEVPIYERFFAGGANTIRGYRERKVGPIDSVTKDPLGGEAMLIGNFEYTYPLFGFLKLAAFFDVGNVWEKVDKFGSGGYKSAMGFGVRLKTPMGPMMVDFGIPFNKEPGEDKKSNGRFHFNMSREF